VVAPLGRLSNPRTRAAVDWHETLGLVASRLRVEGDEPVETVEEIRYVHRGPPNQPNSYALRSWGPSSCGAATKARRSLTAQVVANISGDVSPAMLAGIQNPCPLGERDINALLPKCRAKLGRKLIQHGLDGRIGEMTEVRVDRFARE
jgi:hypothetical protein